MAQVETFVINCYANLDVMESTWLVLTSDLGQKAFSNFAKTARFEEQFMLFKDLSEIRSKRFRLDDPRVLQALQEVYDKYLKFSAEFHVKISIQLRISIESILERLSEAIDSKEQEEKHDKEATGTGGASTLVARINESTSTSPSAQASKSHVAFADAADSTRRQVSHTGAEYASRRGVDRAACESPLHVVELLQEEVVRNLADELFIKFINSKYYTSWRAAESSHASATTASDAQEYQDFRSGKVGVGGGAHSTAGRTTPNTPAGGNRDLNGNYQFSLRSLNVSVRSRSFFSASTRAPPSNRDRLHQLAGRLGSQASLSSGSGSVRESASPSSRRGRLPPPHGQQHPPTRLESSLDLTPDALAHDQALCLGVPSAASIDSTLVGGASFCHAAGAGVGTVVLGILSAESVDCGVDTDTGLSLDGGDDSVWGTGGAALRASIFNIPPMDQLCPPSPSGGAGDDAATVAATASLFSGTTGSSCVGTRHVNGKGEAPRGGRREGPGKKDLHINTQLLAHSKSDNSLDQQEFNLNHECSDPILTSADDNDTDGSHVKRIHSNAQLVPSDTSVQLSPEASGGGRGWVNDKSKRSHHSHRSHRSGRPQLRHRNTASSKVRAVMRLVMEPSNMAFTALGTMHAQALEQLRDRPDNWLAALISAAEALPLAFSLAMVPDGVSGQGAPIGGVYPLIFINKAFEKFSGFHREKVLGRGMRDFLQCAATEPVAEQQLGTIPAHPKALAVLTHCRHSGEQFQHLVALKPVVDTTEVFCYVLGLHFDVTRDADGGVRARRIAELLIDCLPAKLPSCEDF